MKKLTTKGLTRAEMRGYSIVPMMTPVTADGELDEPAVTRLAGHVIGGGSQGLMVAGTTGEFASMTLSQRRRLVELSLDANGGRGVIFGGIGDTSLANSVELARAYLRSGADAVVANLPSYYPISPVEMERYFLALAERVDGPLYLYNIPQTTRLSIPLDVVERLSAHPRIAGIKDSEPDAARQEKLATMFRGREDFVVFCGNVAQTSRAIRAGADGFVPGGGNVVPGLMRELMDRLRSGEGEPADDAQRRVDAFNALFQKGRAMPQALATLKGMLEILGICGRHMLAPLVPLTDAELDKLRGELKAAGISP